MRRAPSVVELASLEELEAFAAELRDDDVADVFLAYRLGERAGASRGLRRPSRARCR